MNLENDDAYLDPDKPNITRVIMNGFQGIDLPSDTGEIVGPCKLLVIGLGEFFSEQIESLLLDPSIQFDILNTDADEITGLRARSICWSGQHYQSNVDNNRTAFFNKYNKGNTFKTYDKFPFGLYLKIEKYSWFTPLWNKFHPKEPGTAIHQRTLEIKTESYLGYMLEINFNALWKCSKPTIFTTS